MTNIQAKQKKIPKTAQDWLAYIEALHPKLIAMGLDRVQAVANKLHLTSSFTIITVAGTNGKGSVCAMLNQIYLQAGYSVGCYTSPHLIRYNERVQVNQQEISDDDLCAAFAAVEAARGDVALTYFEMGTLAAMWHFCQAQLDVVILEVGLGGRLDAVNIFEPKCSIVTAIELDHMEFLGGTREKIGFEKAGIFRTQKLGICGDENPPNHLVEYAAEIGANLALINHDFLVKKTAEGWQYLAGDVNFFMPDLGLSGDFQHNNAACVLYAVQQLNATLPVSQADIYRALSTVQLSGRFQKIHTQPTIFVDVAHNPHASISLAQNLAARPNLGKTLAVFAMLADKDIAGVVRAINKQIDAWYLADIPIVRGATAQELKQILNLNVPKIPKQLFANVASALAAAYKDAEKNDRIIVFGSFYTVADAISSPYNCLHHDH